MILVCTPLDPLRNIVVQRPKPDLSFSDAGMSRYSVMGPNISYPVPPSCTHPILSASCILCTTIERISDSPPPEELVPSISIILVE